MEGLVGHSYYVSIIIVVLIVVISVDDIQVTQRLSAMYTSDSACDCYLPRSPYRLNGICCEAEVQTRTHRSDLSVHNDSVTRSPH